MQFTPTNTPMMAQLLSYPLASTFLAFLATINLLSMATFILRSNKLVHALSLFCLMLMIQKGDAYDFIVGGQKGWSVPSDSNINPFNQWAEKSRFQIGDSLGQLCYSLFGVFSTWSKLNDILSIGLIDSFCYIIEIFVRIFMIHVFAQGKC